MTIVRINIIHVGNKNTHKKIQLKQSQIDQSMTLSICSVECGEYITKVMLFFGLGGGPVENRVNHTFNEGGLVPVSTLK